MHREFSNGALVYAIVVGGIASLIAYFGAPTFVGHQKGAALALTGDLSNHLFTLESLEY